MRCLKFMATKVIILSLLLIPAISYEQPYQPGQASSGPPPIAPPLVREGDFAINLLAALGLGSTADEIAAETRLGDLGIAPRNGWIADYPVTPDILGELQKSISDAAQNRKIPMSRDEALQRLADVNNQLGLGIRPFAGNEPYTSQSPGAENYPNPETVNNYYEQEGPPVVTYYAPPPDYYYLYAWVPSPFWCYGFWFPGFFVLHDFHRIIHVHNRTAFVSNHFNDFNDHRVFRIDPNTRFRGRTFAGIGAPHRGAFRSTGVPGSDRRIFNAPPRTAEGSRMATPAPGGSRMVSPPSGAFTGGRGGEVAPEAAGHPSGGAAPRAFGTAPHEGGAFTPHSGGSEGFSGGAHGGGMSGGAHGGGMSGGGHGR